jgi:hypothetical protein
MRSKKTLNQDGTTQKIILESNGVYKTFTPLEAAKAINELKAQLWSGVPLSTGFEEARSRLN